MEGDRDDPVPVYQSAYGRDLGILLFGIFCNCRHFMADHTGENREGAGRGSGVFAVGNSGGVCGIYSGVKNCYTIGNSALGRGKEGKL